MIDQDRIRQKIQVAQDGLRKLEMIKRYSYEEFVRVPFVADACLRNLQVTIEALVDIGSHIVARHGYGLPKTYQDVIKALVINGVLEAKHQDNYVNMVKFRNRIVHMYDDVNMEEVYAVVQNNLPDFRTFITSIIKKYFGPLTES